jgi:hypothetical protein
MEGILKAPFKDGVKSNWWKHQVLSRSSRGNSSGEFAELKRFPAMSIRSLSFIIFRYPGLGRAVNHAQSYVDVKALLQTERVCTTIDYKYQIARTHSQTWDIARLQLN